MARRCLKHILLFFLGASVIVGAAEGYKESDYESLGDIDSGSYGKVSKVREKKTGKIYALKTFASRPEGYEHAGREINALRQFDHENIIKMRTSNRQRSSPVHIVLEHMPFDLKHAIKNQPEIKENIREILYQVLSGVAHIHSKRLAHRDLKPENILIDPADMSVKICDFGVCGDVKEETFLGSGKDWYHRDVLAVVYLMVHLYLGGSFEDWFFSKRFSIGEIERFVKAKESGVILDSRLGTLYKKMEGVVSDNGLDLFLKLIGSKRKGGYTTAAGELKHPFFAEGHEQDPLPKEPKQRHAQDTPTKEPNNGSTTAEEPLEHPFSDEGY
ncbi:MAG: CMGC/CDKL protein kinase, partial [Amphiamblys sp. WSBS2006]